YLKIDISLVRDVHVSMVNRAMVKAIVSLGHGIGATVIAEGIHTEDESQALRTMGVDFGQGYYLARPFEASAQAGNRSQESSLGATGPSSEPPYTSPAHPPREVARAPTDARRRDRRRLP